MSKNKYPGLSTLERVDSKTGADVPFPIASVSKSFCGALCALMAVDGEFGEKGIDVTLEEVLQAAKLTYPARAETIDGYLAVLKAHDFLDIKLSELLTHRSGIKDADELAPSACKSQTPLDFFSSHLRASNRGDFSYSNNGYVLLEEIINLVSASGSYQTELRNRVLDKLGLENTGVLEDETDPKTAIAKTHLGQAVFVPGTKQNPHSDKVVEAYTEFPANHTTPLGPVSASCGGLYSTVEDLTKFADALARMVCGVANPLTDKVAEASALYRRQLSDSSTYSLGVEFGRGEKCVMRHTGLFPGNYASMVVFMPCSFAKLKSGEELVDAEGDLTKEIFMQKSDYMTSALFTERAGAALSEVLEDFSDITVLEEFRDAWPKIAEESNAVKKYLIEHYLNEDGIIDSDRIHRDFPDVAAVDEVANPLLHKTKELAVEKLESFRQKHRWRARVSGVSEVASYERD